MKRLTRNLTAFLYGVFFVIFIAGASEAFATDVLTEQEAWDACIPWSANYSTPTTCTLETHNLPWRVTALTDTGGQMKWWTFDKNYACEHGRDETGCLPPPPACEPPLYEDPETGECVQPEEICYTNLESMADECVYIGPDDPEDDVPPGCVLDENTGKQFCLSENEGCTIVNGLEYCPDPAEVCGIKNGAYECVNPEQEGCGYYNGERVCFDPNGEKVESDSPDHPDNGGNLDGNPENDITDNRTPEEGGDPEKQPGYVPPTGEGEGASEATARKNLNENRKTADNTKRSADALDKIEDALSQDKLENESEIKNAVDSAADQAISNTGVDDHIAGIGDSEMTGDMVGDSGDTLMNALPESGACSEVSANLWKDYALTITCEDTQRLRDLLSWIFYVLTVWYLFNLLTTRPTQGMGR